MLSVFGHDHCFSSEVLNGAISWQYEERLDPLVQTDPGDTSLIISTSVPLSTFVLVYSMMTAIIIQ